MQIEDLALVFTPQLGVKGVAHLLECFGSASRIFSATESELREVGSLREEAIRNLIERNGLRAARNEMAYCERHPEIKGYFIVAADSGRYEIRQSFEEGKY